MNLAFQDGLTTQQIEAVIDTIEKGIEDALPAVTRIYVEADSISARRRREKETP